MYVEQSDAPPEAGTSGRSRNSPVRAAVADTSDQPQESVELRAVGWVELTQNLILGFATKRFDLDEQLLTGRRDVRVEGTTAIGT